MHSVIFAGISIINQIVQIWVKWIKFAKLAWKEEKWKINFWKIWEKSPKILGETPNLLKSQDLIIAQGGIFSKTIHAEWSYFRVRSFI